MEGSNQNHAVKSNLYNKMVSFIKHFLLVFPILSFRFHSVPVFLEFYLTLTNIGDQPFGILS